MTKSATTSNKPRKQHTHEFRQEALKLAERIGVAAAARELSLYESQLYAWRKKQQQALSGSSSNPLKLPVLSVSWLNRMKSWPFSKMAVTYFAKRLK